MRYLVALFSLLRGVSDFFFFWVGAKAVGLVRSQEFFVWQQSQEMHFFSEKRLV